MSFDPQMLIAAIEAHGPVARVVVAATRGSVPRDVGAAMLVWSSGQSGTIGGGALEWEAAARARAALGAGTDRRDDLALGPGLGQCCGGHVTLVTEIWDAARLARIEDGLRDGNVARPLPGQTAPMPLALRRIAADARGQGISPAPALIGGWLIEPVTRPERPVWIHGAGHVGRAIATVLAPLPDLDVTLIDTGVDRFPDPLPTGVSRLVAANPADLVAHAPETASHLVLTYSHALDFEICHRLLLHPFRDAGLIGSATKWARFRRRLAGLGHSPAQIARIRCPIGQPALGKHPQAIALGVAAELLGPAAAAETGIAPSQKDRAP